MLALRPTPKLEDHPSSGVRGCLFNLFTATLHFGGRSSIRNPRTRHAVVTGTHIHGITVYTENNMMPINTLHRKSSEFLMLQHVLHLKVIVLLIH